MAFIVRLHPKADEDFIQAYVWYEEQQEGLGEKFIAAVRVKIESIINNPEAFGSKDNSLFREALVRTFPYVIVYKCISKRVKFSSVPSIMPGNIQRKNIESSCCSFIRHILPVISYCIQIF